MLTKFFEESSFKILTLPDKFLSAPQKYTIESEFALKSSLSDEFKMSTSKSSSMKNLSLNSLRLRENNSRQMFVKLFDDTSN